MMRISQQWSELGPEQRLGARASWLRTYRCGFPRRLMIVAAIVAALGAMVSAMAANDDPQYLAPLRFSIPSQPLASALQAYSTATGVQLLYESGVANGRYSTGVEGDMTRDAALRILLSETDLTIHYARVNSVTLAPALSNPDDPPAALFNKADLILEPLRIRRPTDRNDGSQLQAYNGIIRADIQQALRKDAKTRSGSYSAGIKLWIDGPRTVQKTELFRSSGDQERDDAISRLLDGLQISQAPPANTPQPVTIIINVRSM
jgi:hypothetical protein